MSGYEKTLLASVMIQIVIGLMFGNVEQGILISMLLMLIFIAIDLRDIKERL